jgi:hypothetical protein
MRWKKAASRIAFERKKQKKLAEDNFQELRDVAPDLADRVADDADKLTLVAARAILADRRRSAGPQATVVSDEKGDVAAKVAKETPELPRPIPARDTHGVRQAIEETITKRKPQPAAQPSAAQATALEASTNIRQHSRHVIESVRLIGEELVHAKAKLPGGLFSEWLQGALGWGDEDARRFIEVRDHLTDDDTEELGVIDLAGLHIAASFAGNQPVDAVDAPQPGTLAAE